MDNIREQRLNRNQLAEKQADLMVVTISHLLEDEEKVFHGVSSQLPMVSILLAQQMHAKNLTYINIPGGVNPKPLQLAEYTSAGGDQYYKSESVFTLQDVFDLSMRGKLDVAFLSGVQFDKSGNVNASVIGDYHHPKVRLPGGAGSAVLIPTVKKAIIWRSKHDIRTFVEKVNFITTRGNLYKIVTPLGMFKYENGQLDIEAISPYTSVEDVVKATGFKISTNNVKILEAPTNEELRLLQKIDPKGVRYLEF